MKNKITEFIKDHKEVILFALFGVVCMTFAGDLFAQGNAYDLNKLATSVEGQKTPVKSIVSAIVGLIFIAGIIHVIIAFVNHSQNLKQIVMSYVAAFIAFAALWAFL